MTSKINKFKYQERVLLIITSFKVWTLIFVLSLSSVLLYLDCISSEQWKTVTITTVTLIASLREISKIIAIFQDKYTSPSCDKPDNIEQTSSGE